MDSNWQVWSEQVVKLLVQHTKQLQGMQADVAVLTDVVLRQDAETAELRAWIADLEAKQLTLDTDITQVRPGFGPLMFGPGPWATQVSAPVGRTVPTTTEIRITTDNTGGTHGSTT